MASRLFYRAQGITSPGTVWLAGSFAPNGSSAVAASSRKGLGFTVARTSAGLFTVTLTDKFAALVAANVSLQLATGADQFVQLGTVDLSAKTIQIRVWDISGAAVDDVAANANNRVHFLFVFSNTAHNQTNGG